MCSDGNQAEIVMKSGTTVPAHDSDMDSSPDLGSIFGDWRPEAVIFDCDGLLMDTESLWVDTQGVVCKRYGIAFDSGLQHRLVGMPASRIGPIIAGLAGQPSSSVIDELLDVNAELVREFAGPLPGAHEVVTAVAARVPVAVASNSARRILDATLGRGDFGDVFACVLSADEVGNPKPAPDIYLAAAETLGFRPDDCLALEDSETGAAAALAAGMKVIGVPRGSGQRPVADAVIGDLESVVLRRWIASWA